MEKYKLEIRCPSCGKVNIVKTNPIINNGEELELIKNFKCERCKHLLGFDVVERKKGDIIYLQITASGIESKFKNWMKEKEEKHNLRVLRKFKEREIKKET